MLSILVGHCYFLRLDHKQLERAKPYPPLATLQVAELLRRAGHQVRPPVDVTLRVADNRDLPCRARG